MAFTRELPKGMLGLCSLQTKGILNINDKVILHSGQTIGHPVEFTMTMKNVIKKKYFKEILDCFDGKPQIYYWQK